jgi:hypothetical protein
VSIDSLEVPAMATPPLDRARARPDVIIAPVPAQLRAELVEQLAEILAAAWRGRQRRETTPPSVLSSTGGEEPPAA